MEPSKAQHRIERKPIPTAEAASAHAGPPSPGPGPYDDVLDDLIDGYLEQPPPYSEHAPGAPYSEHAPEETSPNTVTRTTNALTLDTPVRPRPPPRQVSAPLLISPPSEIAASTAVTTPETPPASRSIWKTAVDETIYFAGGLISRPSESTKHYSVLRHSPGLVYYKGSSTNVTITVFSDAPLPPDRTLWLQRRGFSGDLGMKTSALFGTSSNWIDVTPSSEAPAADVPESDERAWQRDIKKFLKKAASHRHLAKQAARETCLVRIPASADDGYLRVLLCAGGGSKKVLCPSPVFRVASLSSDVSVVRGASLATMPLEMGLKVASVAAEQYMNRFVTPAAALVQSRAKKLQPGFLKKEVVRTALRDNYNSIEERYAPTRAATYDSLHAPGGGSSGSTSHQEIELLPELVGSDDGPEQPFPISLKGKVVRGTGRSAAETGIPTANLSGVPGDLLLRLGGIYIGWAAVQPKPGLEAISHGWHEALIRVAPSPYAAARIVAKNVASVQIIHDFGAGTSFFDATLDVVIMAFLRPVLISAPKPNIIDNNNNNNNSNNNNVRLPLHGGDTVAAFSRDVDVAVLSLARENWHSHMAVEQVRTAKSQRSFADLALAARGQIQIGIDNIPMHRLGVRTTGSRLKDQARGIGGMYIRR
ncbi:hypothetical protein SLS62_007070 [Diatrype stigma]|uniref:Riboflavin kinase n=1 Tax=Diatrype stigma TaxID=117547 RepID=A0AAN9UZX8_9PEZI